MVELFKASIHQSIYDCWRSTQKQQGNHAKSIAVDVLLLALSLFHVAIAMVAGEGCAISNQQDALFETLAMALGHAW